MSIWDKAKAKAEELYGRAEAIYGETHGDAAAEVRGEAHLVEAEAEEAQTAETEAEELNAEAAAEEEHLGQGPSANRWPRVEGDATGR